MINISLISRHCWTRWLSISFILMSKTSQSSNGSRRDKNFFDVTHGPHGRGTHDKKFDSARCCSSVNCFYYARRGDGSHHKGSGSIVFAQRGGTRPGGPAAAKIAARHELTIAKRREIGVACFESSTESGSKVVGGITAGAGGATARGRRRFRGYFRGRWSFLAASTLT